MSALDFLFNQVQNAIQQHSSPNTPGPSYDANPLLGAISSIFGNHAAQNGQTFNADPQHAQYANQFSNQYGNVLPSSADPYGDPADQQQSQFGNVLPSSADPYGDPADQQR